jgi:hypothetical protein
VLLDDEVSNLLDDEVSTLLDGDNNDDKVSTLGKVLGDDEDDNTSSILIPRRDRGSKTYFKRFRAGTQR